MAEILFTHSYFLRFDPKEFKAMMPYPPLGTITAAGKLRNAGFSVALHDVMLAESEDEINGALQRENPKLVVIYDDSFNYLTKMCLSRMREAAFRMAAHARRHGCLTIVFSSDATDHLEEYFSHEIDFVMCGEAELTLTELSSRLLRGKGPRIRDIQGLAFSEKGFIRRTPKRPVVKNLDSLPVAAWDLIDMPAYRNAWTHRHGFFSLNISTTRGCPFHCNWCAKPLYGQVYNSRSPQSVVNEMKMLERLGKPDHLWITDDIFGLTPGWIAEFATLVRDQGAAIPFKCLSRPDLLLNDGTIGKLASAGCKTVWIGAESGAQEILDAMEKGTTVDQIRRATTLLHEAGISVGFFLQFGYPGERWENILQTLELVRQCKPDEIGISVSYPLPGTPFYERVKADLGAKQNWIDSQDLDILFPGEYPPDFYRILHRFVHKQFSIWRKTSQIRDLLRNPGTLSATHVRSIVAIIYHVITLPWYRIKLNHERKRRYRISAEPSPARA